MRGSTIILIATLGAVLPVQDVAQAQLSPQGIVGGITRPFRQMLGHFGHYPRGHRHRATGVESRAAAIAPSNEPSTFAGSHLGSVGPPTWPSAFEDVLGFTFWADDYASRLRGHGFDVIADTVGRRFDLPRVAARTATTGAAVSDANNSVDRCGGTSSAQDNWPAVRIQQMQLSDAQHDGLEKLQAVAVQSIKNVKADCHDPAALAAPDRLRALVQTLWVVRDAGISMREPLKNFYDTLSAQQKNSFMSRPQSSSTPDQKIASGDANKQYQACAAQNVEKAERMVKEIEMKVRPDKDQAASFENFHKVSSNMAKLLIASCAQPIPTDPMERLDAANDQLTAINYAATTVQIAFDDFYLKLKNHQKARFESSTR